MHLLWPFNSMKSKQIVADNKVRFDIEANSDAAQKAVAALRREFDTTLNALKKQQGDVALFKSAQKDAAQLEAQIKKLAKAGGDTSALNATLTAQRTALAQQDAALKQSGINTAQLASEQVRLKLQVDQTTRTFRQQSAVLNATTSIAAQTAAVRASGLAAVQAGIQYARYAAALFLPAAGVAGLVSLVKHSIDAADRLNDLRQITGLSVPTLNGLSLAAKQSGTDLDSLAKGVGKFAKFVGAAKDPTSSQSKLLGELGIKAKEPEAALLQIADIFVGLPDGLEKTNLAMELFGKAGAELIPLLNGGSAALQEMISKGQELNPVTQETAEKADKFNDSLASLKVAGAGLGTAIAAELLPQMDETAKRMTELTQRGNLLGATLLGIASVGKIPFDLAFPEPGPIKDAADEVERLKKLIEETKQKIGTGKAPILPFIGIDYKLGAAALEKLRKDLGLQEFLLTSEQARLERVTGVAGKKLAESTAARNEIQKSLADQLIKIKEFETEKIKTSLEAQTAAYEKAKSKQGQIEQERLDLANKNKQRIEDIQTPPAAKLDLKSEDPSTRFFEQAKGRSQFNELRAKTANELANKDFDKAILLGDKASEINAQLSEAGADSASQLLANQRAIAELQDQAAAGKADQNKVKVEEARAGLEAIKKELTAFERIPIGFDLEKAEAAIIEANKKMQAVLDAHPLKQPLGFADVLAKDNLPKRAYGGLIYGPGTGTSDSILARLSHGEYVIRAAAVKKLGLDRLHAINQGRLPGFADGGAIMRSVASLPQISGAGGDAGARNILNLTLPEFGTIETRVSDAVAAQIQRVFRTAALQHGRRK